MNDLQERIKFVNRGLTVFGIKITLLSYTTYLTPHIITEEFFSLGMIL